MSDSTLAKEFRAPEHRVPLGPPNGKNAVTPRLPMIEGRQDFSIQLPPPNVTGTLHMGHAFNQTIMDSLTRYHRMPRENTLWLPGTDHAGIATQIVVERQLDAQGVSRHDLGREEFLKRVWEWKQKSGSTITGQVRRLGASIDWSREYFTMDDKMSPAVIDVFVTLYKQGLIYRGKRLVNWDPVLGTAVSDLEVVSEEEDGFLWHIRYPLADGSGHLTVATTRPETMLGDVAVMVHPEDERYAHLIGKNGHAAAVGSRNPDHRRRLRGSRVRHGRGESHAGARFQRLRRRPAPPAPADRDLHARSEDQRQRARKVPQPRPLRRPQADRGRPRSTRPARIGEESQADDATRRPYERRNRAHAHRPVVRGHEQAGARRHVPSGQVDRANGARCGAQRRNQIRAENWSTTYYQWLENIQDWCISRQLWWGHQIPAWYGENGEIFVAKTESDARADAARRVTQVLSSATTTCSTPGFHPPWCHFPRWAGLRRRRNSSTSCRLPSSSQASTSSSSGSPGW